MGCATSKQQPVCRNCHAPVPRSYSMHVHHPPQRQGDTYHVVALTSTTLGSLKLDPFAQNHNQISTTNDTNESHKSPTREPNTNKENGDDNSFSMGLIEAKTWSNMINEKITKVVPRTPVRTPPGDPETINAWELMEGLDDTSPLRPPSHHLRSFSFHVGSQLREHDISSPKPLWLGMAENESNSNNSHSNSTSIASEFDPDVIATFRKSLEELPPANPFHLKPISVSDDKLQAVAGNGNGNGNIDESLGVTDGKGYDKCAPRAKDKLILYFTSLRGVRKTYEDCCHVRVILKGIGVRVDERDVSMHSGFKDELKELLGDRFNGGGLPRVFLGKKYIGGADEIRKLHEDGQLEKLLDGCGMLDDGGGGCGGGGAGVCEGCGDIRFIPCETCSGSSKVYYEGDYDEEGEDSDNDRGEDEEGEYGFQRCPDCNENGLIRCPICCD